METRSLVPAFYCKTVRHRKPVASLCLPLSTLFQDPSSEKLHSSLIFTQNPATSASFFLKAYLKPTLESFEKCKQFLNLTDSRLISPL